MARTKKDLDDFAPPDREYYPVDAPGPTTAPPSADDLARQQRRAEQKQKAKEILQTGGRYAAMTGGALVKGVAAASSGLMRMAVSLAGWGAATDVCLTATQRTRTRPDMGWLRGLLATAEGRRDVRARLSWRADPLIAESNMLGMRRPGSACRVTPQRSS